MSWMCRLRSLRERSDPGCDMNIPLRVSRRRRRRPEQRVPPPLRQLVAAHERGGAGCREAPGDTVALGRRRMEVLEIARESATGVAGNEDQHPRLAPLVAEPAGHDGARSVVIRW